MPSSLHLRLSLYNISPSITYTGLLPPTLSKGLSAPRVSLPTNLDLAGGRVRQFQRPEYLGPVCCWGSNVGPEAELGRPKGEGRIQIKDGEGEELHIHSSALGEVWKRGHGSGRRQSAGLHTISGGDKGLRTSENGAAADLRGEEDRMGELDSGVFSLVVNELPCFDENPDHAAVADEEHKMEDGQRGSSLECCEKHETIAQEVTLERDYAASNNSGNASKRGLRKSVDAEEGPTGFESDPKDSNNWKSSEDRTQEKDEPVFLEVIPQDIVTIHPDTSQTVGSFDGQQPLVVIEEKEREAKEEEVKQWETWPTELQTSQIRIKEIVKGRYGKELTVAVQAVQLACMLSQRVQERVLRNEEKAGSKKDKSLVTVADWGVQAVVSWVLSQAFEGEEISMVAEEDTKGLRGDKCIGITQRVVNAVNECLFESSVVGIAPPKQPLGSFEVLKAINKGTACGGSEGRHWVLDPVDGTLGFVRGDQYAVALAMVEDGQVVLGVLGCPNLPMRTAWLGYHHRYYRMAMKLAPPSPGIWHRGCVMTAQKGDGHAWMQPMIFNGKTFNAFSTPREVTVSAIVDPAEATFCEPVEKSNSSHTFTAGLADTLGLRNQPLRVYSMAKYAAIARGDAEIFMKFAKAGYKEKIWDHAAGVLIVQEAGGVVTDAGGRPLDFSKGRFLEGLDRGIVASSGKSLHDKIISAVDASWNSSTL